MLSNLVITTETKSLESMQTEGSTLKWRDAINQPTDYGELLGSTISVKRKSAWYNSINCSSITGCCSSHLDCSRDRGNQADEKQQKAVAPVSTCIQTYPGGGAILGLAPSIESGVGIDKTDAAYMSSVIGCGFISSSAKSGFSSSNQELVSWRCEDASPWKACHESLCVHHHCQVDWQCQGDHWMWLDLWEALCFLGIHWINGIDLMSGAVWWSKMRLMWSTTTRTIWRRSSITSSSCYYVTEFPRKEGDHRCRKPCHVPTACRDMRLIACATEIWLADGGLVMAWWMSARYWWTIWFSMVR